MATFYFDSNALTNGDGLTELTPYNTPPVTAFGANTWNLAAGSTWDAGASALTGTTNTILQKWGTGADPIITGSNATLLNISTANNIQITDVELVRAGSPGGIGLNSTQVGAAPSTPGLIFTRGAIRNFNTNLLLDRSDNCSITEVALTGPTTTAAIKAAAFSAGDVNNLKIKECYISCGAGISFTVSDVSDSAGKFVGLEISNNLFENISGGAITMRNSANSISTTATTSVSGSSTLTRSSNWPVAWAPGKKIFLGGFTDPTNYGIFTVVSVSGTLLTVTEPTAIETAAVGKGIYLMNDNQAFINPKIVNNTITNSGQTPMLIDNFVGGVISGNKITQSQNQDINAGAIEMLAFKDTVVEFNYISGIKTTGTVDAMGIFTDGGCDNVHVRFNAINNLVGTDRSNSGAGIAAFYARNCQFYSNIVSGCKVGYWTGGTAGGNNSVFQNTFTKCISGMLSESNTFINNTSLSYNLFFQNNRGIADNATSIIATNAYWQNTVDSSTGALSAKDATAITTDPMLLDLVPKTGSPLIGAVPHTVYRRDGAGTQRYNPGTIGALEPTRARQARV
jgi:hypothetical protein